MASNRTIRIALAQMASAPGQVEANLDQVARHVERARDECAQLLVFPELALSGYALGDTYADAAVRADSQVVRRLRELSRKVDLAIGLIEETEDVEFFNCAMYLSAGRVVHVHRKVYLPTYRVFDERRYFGPGRGVWAFDTPWARMAMLICGDCWHLSLPYLAVHDGADVLLILAASSTKGLSPSVCVQSAWRRMNRSYALTLSTFVVFVNRVGSERDLDFWGGSNVVLPDGNLLAEAGGEATQLVAELDLGLLRHQRLILPFRRDDSLAFTLDIGRRVLRSKTRRRDGFLASLGLPDWPDAQSEAAAPPASPPET